MPFFYALLRRQEILYYCEVADDRKLILHQGEKAGPVICTADPCLAKHGSSDLHFVDPEMTVSLHYKYHRLHPKLAKFSIDNKSFRWKGYDELLEDGTNRVVAKFHSKW